jgi:Tfp pilus assembly protein PilW
VTLVELVLAMSLGLVVCTAGLVFLIVTLHQSNAVGSRTVAARNAETALEQLSRDLRQAMTQNASGTSLPVTLSSAATTPPTTSLSFSIPTPGADTTPQSVTWSCQGSTSSPGSCTRTIGSAKRTLVVGFESMSFTDALGNALTLPITTTPTNPLPFLGITMDVQVTSQLDANQYKTTPTAYSGSSKPIVVQTGVDLRNQS